MHVFWVIPEDKKKKKKKKKNRKKVVKVMSQKSFCWNRTPESMYLERHTGYKELTKKVNIKTFPNEVIGLWNKEKFFYPIR